MAGFVFSLLAVLAAQIVLVVLFFAEKKRSDRRYQAMLDYMHRYVEDVASSLETQIVEEKTDSIAKMDEALRRQHDDMIARFNKVDAKFENVDSNYKNLEMDYSQAQDAAKRINDFGSSLASIFDYDPMQAIRKGRTKEAS